MRLSTFSIPLRRDRNNICGPHTVTAKNTRKTQEKPNPSWLFQSTKQNKNKYQAPVKSQLKVYFD